MDMKELYEKYGLSVFKPEDRRFISQMANNGWDIRKIDLSKFSKKEINSFFKVSDPVTYETSSFKDFNGKIKGMNDNYAEFLNSELERNVINNSRRFNDHEFGEYNIELGKIDLSKINGKDFMKAYEKRASQNNGTVKLSLGDDGKIKFSTELKGEDNGENIYNDLNTGENEIWDILGGKIHKFNISVPSTGKTARVDASVDPKSFQYLADSDFDKFLSSDGVSLIKDDGNYFTPLVDEDYKRILRQNIEEIKRRLPGFKEFGSSVSASRMGLPHATDDIDGFMTRRDFINVFGKDALRSMPSKRTAQDGSGRIITYKYNMDVGAPEKMPIDINIVDEPENLGELIRQVEPETYYNYMQNISKNGKYTTPFFSTNYLIDSNPTRKSAIDPEFLLRKMDPESKTIADMFEIDFAGGKNGSKMKHKYRPIVMIANGDPEKVSKGMDMWAKGNFGPNIKQAPDMRSQFTDVERNKKMLQQMGYEYGGAETDIAKDPQKMQNAFNYWYLSTTIRGRGVDPTGKTPVYTMMTDWNPASLRGNANGAGLNTVTMGDSGHGQIYGYIQPNLRSERFSTPEEVISSANRSMGMSSYKITKDEADKINKIISDNLNGRIFTKIKEGDSLENILDVIPIEGNESDKILDELDRQLGFRSITRKTNYRNELYSSMTGEIRPEETVAINYPRTASLFARKGKFNEGDSYSIYSNGSPLSTLKGVVYDMGGTNSRGNYKPMFRRKIDYSYDQIGNFSNENSIIGMAFTRKSRTAQEKLKKARFEKDNAYNNLNAAKNNERLAYRRSEDASKKEMSTEAKYRNSQYKYNLGTKYLDFGIRSGFGLYGLYNLPGMYRNMIEKSRKDRERGKKENNRRRFGNEK